MLAVDNLERQRGQRRRVEGVPEGTHLEEEHAERRRETELWETIKVRSLSRLLVTTYGHSLLLLVLTGLLLLTLRLLTHRPRRVDPAGPAGSAGPCLGYCGRALCAAGPPA